MKKSNIILGVSCMLLMTACTNNDSIATDPTISPTTKPLIDTNQETKPSTALPLSEDMFTTRDLEVGYDVSSATKIDLANGTTTISQEGVYILTGSLANGQIVIDAPDTAKIQIVLDNVTISNNDSAAIYVKQANKVFITMAQNSINTLSVTGEYVNVDDNNVDAVIFSKDDITFNGLGTLNINGNGNAITSKDDLIITSGTYNINVTNHALDANNSIRIADGDFNLTSGKDGLHASHKEDSTLGYIYIKDGNFVIEANGDGFDASSALLIVDGQYKINTNGDANTNSSKGIKATGDLSIENGTFTLVNNDDAIHSNNNVTINNGTYLITSLDDAIHADNNVTINDGTIEITKSYEGIEGQSIDINNGDIKIVSLDDGINAAGGNDQSSLARPGANNFNSNTTAYININGGNLFIDAIGDGIDSNGNLTINGGYTVVNGPTSGGNGALDYDAKASIEGGTIIAIGSSGMAQNFSSAAQGSMLINTSTSYQAGTQITLSDASGNVIANLNSVKSFNSILISTADIKDGQTYTLKMGNDSQQIQMTSTIYGNGQVMGGNGGQRPGKGDASNIPSTNDTIKPPVSNGNTTSDTTTGATKKG